jgi:hypothetical protein
MKGHKHTKLVRHGEYIVEVEVELFDDDQEGVGWGPYLGPPDAMKLDSVRHALQSGNVQEAMKYGRVFRLTPVSAA